MATELVPATLLPELFPSGNGNFFNSVVSKNETTQPHTIIIVIGGEFIYETAVQMALSYHWCIEVVSYATNITRRFKAMEEDSNKLVIKQLDDVARSSSSSFLYYNPIWYNYRRKLPPLERSFVACFSTTLKTDVTEQLSLEITNIVKFPCSYYSSEKFGLNNIFFIINPSIKKGGYSFTLLWKKNKLAIKSACQKLEGGLLKIMTAFKFFNKGVYKTSDIELNNPYQLLADNDSDDDNEDDFQDYEDTENESSCDDDIDSGGDTDDEIAEKMKTFKERRNMKEKRCRYHFTCQGGLNCKYQHEVKEKKFFEHNGGKGIVEYKSRICEKCAANVCRHMQHSHLCSEAHDEIEARCYKCDRDGGKLGHTSDQCNEECSEPISEAKNSLKPCKFEFRCKYGLTCEKSHTEDEKRFFNHNNQIGYWNYKTKQCKNHENKLCEFKKDTVLCRFAHNKAEARCKKCNGKGHFQGSEACPKYGR